MALDSLKDISDALDTFKVDDRVQLVGLVAKLELNGRVGRVLGFDEAAQRYMVELQRQSSWDEQSVQVKLKPANLARVEAAEDCAICMCEAVRPVKLTCDHVFCSSCISKLRSNALQGQGQDTCPLCRAAIADDAEKYFLLASFDMIRMEMPQDDPNGSVKKWAAHEHGKALPTLQSIMNNLEKSLAHNPDHVGSLQVYGELLVDTDPERAIATLRRAESLDPADPCIHIALGKALEATGDLADALKSDLQAAGSVGVRPNTKAGALMQAAIVYEQMGKQPDAIECYRQAEAATPDDYIVPFNLAVCLEETDVEGSIAALERCLKLEPTFYKAYYALAAGYQGGHYRRRIVANDQRAEGLTAQLWISSALAAARLAPRGPEGAEDRAEIKKALELASTAFRGEYQNVLERINGKVTPRQHPNTPFNDCNSFIKWVDAHQQMMASRRSTR